MYIEDYLKMYIFHPLYRKGILIIRIIKKEYKGTLQLFWYYTNLNKSVFTMTQFKNDLAAMYNDLLLIITFFNICLVNHGNSDQIYKLINIVS